MPSASSSSTAIRFRTAEANLDARHLSSFAPTPQAIIPSHCSMAGQCPLGPTSPTSEISDDDPEENGGRAGGGPLCFVTDIQIGHLRRGATVRKGTR